MLCERAAKYFLQFKAEVRAVPTVFQTVKLKTYSQTDKQLKLKNFLQSSWCGILHEEQRILTILIVIQEMSGTNVSQDRLW